MSTDRMSRLVGLYRDLGFDLADQDDGSVTATWPGLAVNGRGGFLLRPGWLYPSALSTGLTVSAEAKEMIDALLVARAAAN